MYLTEITNHLMKFLMILHSVHVKPRDLKDLILIQGSHILLVECKRYVIHFRTTYLKWVLKYAFLRCSLANRMDLPTI